MRPAVIAKQRQAAITAIDRQSDKLKKADVDNRVSLAFFLGRTQGLREIEMKTIALSVGVLLLATDASLAQTFMGYDCTEDCSGHQAGYEWAERKDIGDPSDCGGNSNSFVEGCRAFAEESDNNSNDYSNGDEDEDEDEADE